MCCHEKTFDGREFDWNFFLESLCFENIIKQSNKMWIVTFAYKAFSDDRYPLLRSVEFPDNSQREYLLKANTYLMYNNKAKEKGKRNVERYITKYNFIEKVLDDYNNLIIIAIEERLDMYEGRPFQSIENISKNRI